MKRKWIDKRNKFQVVPAPLKYNETGYRAVFGRKNSYCTLARNLGKDQAQRLIIALDDRYKLWLKVEDLNHD